VNKLRNRYLFHAGISCFFYLGYGAFTVILSMYCQDIGMSATQIAYIVSFSPLLSIITQPAFGYLADKWKSPRKVSILLMAITILTMFIFAISHNFWILLLSSGIAISFMNAITPLTDRIGVSSPYQFGKIRLWGSLGYAVMAQVSGILYQYISPFSNFMAGILGAILTIICIYFVNDPKLQEVEKVVDMQPLSTKNIVLELIHNRPFIIFMIITFFFWGACSTNFNYLSIFIRSQGGTASQVGTYQLCATLFEIPMILITDYIIKKISFRNIMLFAVSISVINFAWYATLPSVNQIIFVFIFKGFSTVLFTMITVRLVMLLVKEEYVSTAYGIQCMLGKGFGAMIFQLFGGQIIDNIGMSAFYLFLCVGTIIALIFVLLFKLPKREI
jgi:oligosaccharide:H+ symporter